MPTSKLTAIVETKGAKRSDRDLRRFTKSANDAEVKTKKLGRTFKDFGKNSAASIAAIDGPLGGISSRVSSLITVATTGNLAITGLAVAVTALSTAIVFGIKELDKQAIALKTSEALIKATGNAAGVTAQQLEDEARAIALNTLASVDGIRKAQSVLLTFNRIQGDVRKEAVILSQDLATVFGGSAVSQATQLGKALQDPIKGITALRRVGVTFNDTQIEQIKLLQESGDVISAQNIVLRELKNQVGGVAAAVSSDTLAGGFDEFIQRLKQTTELIAGSAGAYDKTLGFFDRLNGVLKGVNKGLEERPLLNAIRNVKTLKTQYQALAEDIKRSESLSFIPDFVVAQDRRKLEQLKTSIDEQKAIISGFSERVAAEEQKQVQAKQKSLNKQQEIQAEQKKKADEALRIESEKIATKEDAKQKIKDDAFNRDKERANNQLQGFIALNDTDLEEVNRREQARLEIIQGYRDQGLIVLSDYQDAQREIEQNAANERIKISENEAKSKAQKEQESSKKRRSTAEGVLADLENIGGRENKIFKAGAKVNAVVKTYEAANSAYASLAPIPIIGPALGVAAAGFAISSGLANVRSIDSAREQGGQINAGDRVLVGERGPEVVSFPNSGKVSNNFPQPSPQVNIVFIDQSTGPKEIDPSTDSEGRTVLLIRDTVRADIADPNSGISKSFAANTNALRSRQ